MYLHRKVAAILTPKRQRVASTRKMSCYFSQQLQNEVKVKWAEEK